jgi:hypothetical protein
LPSCHVAPEKSEPTSDGLLVLVPAKAWLNARVRSGSRLRVLRNRAEFGVSQWLVLGEGSHRIMFAATVYDTTIDSLAIGDSMGEADNGYNSESMKTATEQKPKKEEGARFLRYFYLSSVSANKPLSDMYRTQRLGVKAMSRQQFALRVAKYVGLPVLGSAAATATYEVLR